MRAPVRIGSRELAAKLAQSLSLPEDGVEVLLHEIGSAVGTLLREGHAVELGSDLTLSLEDGIEVGGIEVGTSESAGIEVGTRPPPPPVAAPREPGEVVYLSGRTGPFRERIYAHCRARGLGFHQPIAASEALRWLATHTPGAFVFDSGAAGWRELVRELKCDPGTNHVPVVGLFSEAELEQPLTRLTLQPDVALFVDPCPFERFLEEAGALLEGKRTDGEALRGPGGPFEFEAHLSGAQGDRRDACAVVEEVLYRAKLPEYFCRDARRALSEALDNAVRHGHGRDERRTVALRMMLDEKQLVLAVRDGGDGFAHEVALARAAAAAQQPVRHGTRQRGLVHLARLTDTLAFNGPGNECVLTRLLPRR